MNSKYLFLIVCFLLGNSLESELYMPTFRNTLFHLRRQLGMKNETLKTLYMTVNLICQCTCSLVCRQNFRAEITFFKPLIQICLKKGHAN